MSIVSTYLVISCRTWPTASRCIAARSSWCLRTAPKSIFFSRLAGAGSGAAVASRSLAFMAAQIAFFLGLFFRNPGPSALDAAWPSQCTLSWPVGPRPTYSTR